MKIQVGISSCLLGNQVRFDGGHKRSNFAATELSQFFDFTQVCPEMAIGMSAPRPTIRLIENDDYVKLVDSKDYSIDHTRPMRDFSTDMAIQLAEKSICGYIVCKGSPTCGMERVKIYQEKTGYSKSNGVGLYTQALIDKMPWLPIEEDGRLNDLLLRENFVTRVFALQDFYAKVTFPLSRRMFIDFHSRYKLTLMAHNQKAYRDIGNMLGSIDEYALEDFYELYRERFMQALKKPANKRNHTNTLQHIQGYFKRVLDKTEKAELTDVISQYHSNQLPLMAPLTLFNHYLKKYPNNYLLTQAYFNPYPQNLRLRLAL